MEQARDDHGRSQAKAQFESIKEMLENYNNAQTDSEREEAEQVIWEDPLSIEVRSNWHTPGGGKDTEYNILLCTGGPAVRIVGDLSEYQEPETAHLEYQDWFTPWERYYLSGEETEILLAYSQRFYFAS